MIRNLILCCVFCLSIHAIHAQNEAENSRLSLNVVIPETDIPAESMQNLESKLLQIASSGGFTAHNDAGRFVLTARIDVQSKDIVPSTPPRVSQKLEITVMVGDVLDDRIYASTTVATAGIGTTETKAFISSFSRLNAKNTAIQNMLSEANAKIVSYYETHCDEIINHAQTLAGMQRFDEAIFRLMTIPDVCSECYSKCQSAAGQIYIQKRDTEAAALLNKAKNAWMHQPDPAGAKVVAEIINDIDLNAENYDDVVALRNDISAKLDADAKREWDFQMKQYEDKQLFKRSIVEACKAIGVAWGNGQPKTVTKTIIQRWR